MNLEELRVAFAEAGDSNAVDVTDRTVYPDEWVADVKRSAIETGMGLGPDQLDAKRQYLAIATILDEEQARRSVEENNVADDVSKVDEALDTLADGSDQPVAAAVDSTFADSAADAAREAAREAAEGVAAQAAEAAQGVADSVNAPAAPAEEGAEADQGEAPADPAALAGVPADPSAAPATTPTENDDPASGEEDTQTDAATAEDPSTTQEDDPTMNPTADDRVATLEAQVAALTANARLASVNLGDAPGQAAPAAPEPRRMASLTILSDDLDHERTLDVGKLGRRVSQVAEQNQGVAFNKVIATVQQFEDGTPSLRAGQAASNTELIFAGSEKRRAARTAAAMECGPNARVEAIPTCFIADRPVASMFSNRWQLETMRYEFYRGISLSQIAAPTGVQEVSSAFQAAIDPDDPSTWKQCARLDCDDIETVIEQGWAVWSCLILNEFQNMTIIPIAENRINALAAQTARLADSLLLRKLRQLSFQYTAVAPLGAGAGLMEVLDAAVAGYEWVDRLSDASWTPLIPRSLDRVIASDRRNRAFGGDDGSRMAVDALFRDAGYNSPVVYFDDYAGAATAQWDRPGTIGTASALPTQLARTYRVYLVDTDSMHMAQRNIISMREMRDMNLCRQNEYAMVMESAEALGRHGCIAPIAIDVTLCPSGARAALERYNCGAADYSADVATGA